GPLTPIIRAPEDVSAKTFPLTTFPELFRILTAALAERIRFLAAGRVPPIVAVPELGPDTITPKLDWPPRTPTLDPTPLCVYPMKFPSIAAPLACTRMLTPKTSLRAEVKL